jgi:adenosylhomocysteine nucleosidase
VEKAGLMIAITFALPTESSGFISRLSGQTEIARDGVRLIRGRIENNEVEILHSGVGTRTCQQRVEKFLRGQNFKFLISSGFAGAVAAGFNQSDLLLAKNFSQPQLLSAAQQILQGRPIHAAKLFTAPAVIDSKSERDAIAKTADAAAVDMETSAIAEACSARGIALLSLRIITDTPGNPLPAPPNILFDIDRQRTPFLRLAGYAVTNPAVIGRLLRFRQQIANARETLADAIVSLIRKL